MVLGFEDTGVGISPRFDFIIVHESAHEWFGNNVTAKDNADMWVHESFANYAEGIYTECLAGKDAGARYIIGNRRGIRNDRPIIPAYNVDDQGSGDMYPKGGEMLHTIRQLVNDDEKWRRILTGMNKTFWHQTVTGAQIEAFFATSNPINDYTLPLHALTRGAKVDAGLAARYGGVRIEDLWLPFFCVSSNLTTGNTMVHRSGDLPKALRASIAIPGLLPPVLCDVPGASLLSLAGRLNRTSAPARSTSTLVASSGSFATIFGFEAGKKWISEPLSKFDCPGEYLP